MRTAEEMQQEIERLEMALKASEKKVKRLEGKVQSLKEDRANQNETVRGMIGELAYLEEEYALLHEKERAVYARMVAAEEALAAERNVLREALAENAERRRFTCRRSKNAAEMISSRTLCTLVSGAFKDLKAVNTACSGKV